MEMPSDTVIVLKSTPLPPAALAPASASCASSLMCMLQGVRFAQVEAMPTCGLVKSASLKPTARSIARLGLRATPAVISFERQFSAIGVVLFRCRVLHGRVRA